MKRFWLLGLICVTLSGQAARSDVIPSFDSAFAFGVRAVGGMLFDFKNVPLDAFIEVAGVLEYEFRDGAGAGIKLNAGAGVRYYF